MLEAVFYIWFAPKLYKELVLGCELVWLGSQVKKTAEIGGWQLEISPARELTAEGSTSCRQRSE
jgi:hypothetical protein